MPDFFLKLSKSLFLVMLLLPSVAFTKPLRPASLPVLNIHHDLSVKIAPEKKSIRGEDTITLPAGGRRKIRFYIRHGLTVTSLSGGVSIRKIEKDGSEDGERDNFGLFLPGDNSVTGYLMELTADSGKSVKVTLKYNGKIISQKSKSQGGVSSFSAPVSSKGIFLTGGDFWYPRFTENLVTFTLKAVLPKPWEAVSQGERKRHFVKDGFSTVSWESVNPTDEVLLIGGKFKEFSKTENGITAMAFLRNPDNELAQRYIKTTFFYLDIFQNLIGAYPYKKFALVENFLPTGYGMPSLTLLGANIIRFPFILHTSYPHELLHNWWGNGVFTHHDSGNWAEGLTVYLADHLIKERRGAGVEYRRTSLQNYTDYVNHENDFPLTSFRARKDRASQAIGYGKTMMMFHMLRVKVGDKLFIESIKHFYKENMFRRASFDDIKRSFQSVTGQDFNRFFEQWVSRKGAPLIELSKAVSKKTDKGYLLSLGLNQRIDQGAVYQLDIPVAIELEGERDALYKVLTLDKESMTYKLPLPVRPTAVSVDPGFDVFRRLDRNEIPPSLSRAFGSKTVTIVLPSSASGEMKQAYGDLSRSFEQNGGGKVTVGFDKEFETLPEGTVWLLGLENRYKERAEVALKGYDAALSGGGVRFGTDTLKQENNSFVIVVPRDNDSDDVLVWLFSATPKALPGLARKLPHYGKYSSLTFKGEEPQNIYKGVWPVINSPLSSKVKQHDGVMPGPFSAGLPARHSL